MQTLLICARKALHLAQRAGLPCDAPALAREVVDATRYCVAVMRVARWSDELKHWHDVSCCL